MKSLKEAHSHLQETRMQEANYRKILSWWNNLPRTTQQTLFWKHKGKKNIHVEQFINDYDKMVIYNQQNLNN
jgi:hypothetical protein